jgi:ABC-type multidrug transport system fused ATPase/permease subunit
MIAHRASAVRRADRIFELEDGRVVRSGTWDELNGETQR